MRRYRASSTLRNALLLVVLAISWIAASGCTEKFLEELSSAQNRENIRAVLDVLDLYSAAKETTLGVIDGVREGLPAEELDERVEGAAESYVERVASELAAAIEAELGPVVRAELVSSVRALLAETLTHEDLPDIEATANAIAESTITTLIEGLGSGVRNEIAPALRASMENDIGPGIQSVVETNLRPALSSTAREVGREALLGASDALDGALGANLAAAQDRFFERLERSVQAQIASARRLLVLAAIVLALGLAALIVLLMIVYRKATNDAIKQLAAALVEARRA